MKSNRIQVTIDISEDCYNAMKYLRKVHVNSKQLFRDGGEQYVINVA